MLGYFVGLVYWARRFVFTQETILKQDFDLISQRLIDLQNQKNILFKEKLDLEEEAKNIYTLYELTKEITKSTHEKEALETFKVMLHKHVKFESCEMLEEASKLPEDRKSTRLNSSH